MNMRLSSCQRLVAKVTYDYELEYELSLKLRDSDEL